MSKTTTPFRSRIQIAHKVRVEQWELQPQALTEQSSVIERIHEKYAYPCSRLLTKFNDFAAACGNYVAFVSALRIFRWITGYIPKG